MFVLLVKTKLWYTLNEILHIKNKKFGNNNLLLQNQKDDESIILTDFRKRSSEHEHEGVYSDVFLIPDTKDGKFRS
jgi:hypothetical protein